MYGTAPLRLYMPVVGEDEEVDEVPVQVGTQLIFDPSEKEQVKNEDDGAWALFCLNYRFELCTVARIFEDTVKGVFFEVVFEGEFVGHILPSRTFAYYAPSPVYDA